MTTSTQGAEVVVSRLLEASLGEVWSAFTRRERVVRWLWPVTRWPGAGGAAWEPTAGDRIVFDDPHVLGGLRVDVLDAEPPRRLVVAWGPADADGGTQVSFTLEPEGDATLLVVHQAPTPEVEADGRLRGGADFAAGWHALLDTLSVQLVGEEMPPADELWTAAYAVYSAPGQPTVASL